MIDVFGGHFYSRDLAWRMIGADITRLFVCLS